MSILVSICTTKRLAILGLLATAVSGCTVTRTDAMQRYFHETKSIQDDYPNQSFSNAMQLIYSVERVPPEGVNNFDSFNAFDYPQDNGSNITSAALAFPKSPWLALDHLIIAQRNKGLPLVKENILILMEPIHSSASTPKHQLNAEVIPVVDALTERARTIIKDAYKKSGTPVTLDIADTEHRSIYASWFSPYFLIPDGLDFCPQNVQSLKELTDSQLKYCSTQLTNRGFVNFENPKNTHKIPYAINGNYAYKLVRLPDGFPIESLKSDDKFSFLFVPSFIYHQSDIGEALTKEMIIELAKEDRFSLNPFLKDLNTGEYMYFNPEVSKLQKDKYTRIDEEAVFMTQK